MEFAVIAHDFTDEKALERRMAAREEHLKNAGKMFEDGILIFASALLNDEEKMNGSVMVVDFPSKKELKEKWLNKEAYVTGKVWEKITVQRAKVAMHK